MTLWLALFAAAAAAAAPAPSAPPPGAPPSTVALPPAPDPRIRTRVYSPDTIYRVYGHTGYQIMVQLEPDDRVQTIAIGDASGWQITPNEGRNLVFLKPLRPTLRTNMSIVTDRRTYNFELSAFNGTNARPSDLTYVLRFHYPQPAGAKTSADDQPVLGPGPFNRAYSFEGSDLNVPAQVFDDGKVTYFRFPDGAPRPAIFVLDPGAGESIVNVAYRGPYSVVDRVAPVFILKQGREVTRLYNDGFTAPDLGAEAPRRRTNSKKKRS